MCWYSFGVIKKTEILYLNIITLIILRYNLNRYISKHLRVINLKL